MDRDPLVERRIALETDRLLAAQMIDKGRKRGACRVRPQPRAQPRSRPQLYLARRQEIRGRPRKSMLRTSSSRPTSGQGSSASQPRERSPREARGRRGFSGVGEGGVGGSDRKEQWRPALLVPARHDGSRIRAGGLRPPQSRRLERAGSFELRLSHHSLSRAASRRGNFSSTK